MKIRHVAPGKIVVPQVRVTARFDPETLAMLRASIAAEGLVAPIIVCEVDDPDWKPPEKPPDRAIFVSPQPPKKLVLVDGLHRLQEAIALQLPTVDIAVTEGNMVDVLTRNLFMDHIRGKHPVSEMVKVVEVLNKDFNLDMVEIAKRTGMTQEYVENLMLVSRLTPLVRAALDDGSLKITPAVELTRLKLPAQQEEIFQLYRQYRWTTQELHDYIGQVLEIMTAPPPPPPPPPPPQPPTAECVYCHGQFELPKLSNPTTCVGCFADMINSMAMARQELAREKAAKKDDTPPIARDAKVDAASDRGA